MATIQASDVLPVRSRVSWSAILAGAVTALVIYLVLAALGIALGLTANNRMSERAMAIAAGLWGLGSMLVALFVGGWVSSRCSVGENKTEAALMGVVVWGVTFCLMLALTAGAVNTGLQAALGVANSRAADRLSEEDLRALGIQEGNITKFRERVQNMSQEEVNRARAAAWWTLTGIILSVAASVAGAVVGAGPNLIITALRVRSATVTPESTVTHEPVAR